MGANLNENNTGQSEEIRCFECNKLLAKGDSGLNVYEMKCSRCGAMNSIFRGIDDQVIITDVDGVILYANSRVERITGYGLNEILGKKPSLWGNQMSKEFYAKMWHTIKVKGEPVDVVVKNKTKNGEFYEARLIISPVFDAEGKIKLFVGMESVIKNKKTT